MKLGLLFACGGCASIQSTRSVVDMPLPTSTTHEHVEDSVEYQISASVRGEQIVLAVEQNERCADITTSRTHRRRTITRTADPTVTRATWTIAVLSLGAAAYGYLNAEALSEQETGTFDRAPEYRRYSAGLAGLGIAAGLIGLVDAARARDTEYDDGIIKGESTRDERTCRARTTTNADVVLALANGYTVSGELDARGKTELSMRDIPEAGLPSFGTQLTATISGKTSMVAFSNEQRESIRAALRADPRSRFAIDLLAKHRAECEQAIANARDGSGRVSLDSADEQLRPWLVAKATCDDLWSSQHATELAEAEQRVAEASCNRRLVTIATTIETDGLEALEAVTSELDTVNDACSSAQHAEQARQLAGKLAKLVKHREQQRAEEARRIAREHARQVQAARKLRQNAARAESSNRANTWDLPRTQRSWGSARLLCNDGTLSPSCTCGRSSYRGCCSWHGGVNRCSADN